MTVAEELAMLKSVITEIKSRYCENCQEWDCDYCRAETDSTEHEYTMEEFMFGQDMGNPEDGSL